MLFYYSFFILLMGITGRDVEQRWLLGLINPCYFIVRHAFQNMSNSVGLSGLEIPAYV